MNGCSCVPDFPTIYKHQNHSQLSCALMRRAAGHAQESESAGPTPWQRRDLPTSLLLKDEPLDTLWLFTILSSLLQSEKGKKVTPCATCLAHSPWGPAFQCGGEDRVTSALQCRQLENWGLEVPAR